MWELFAGLGLVGFLISAYFTAAYYGWLRPQPALVPAEFCGIDAQGCQSVVRAPGARVFGVPNSLLGCFFYAATIALAAIDFSRPILLAYVTVAWFTVALGVYLSYLLLFVMRARCWLCFFSHAVNTILAVTATVAARR